MNSPCGGEVQAPPITGRVVVVVGWVAVPLSSSIPMQQRTTNEWKGEVGWVGGTDRRIRIRNYVF